MSDRGERELVARTIRSLDERTGRAAVVRRALGYVFPDHWAFLLGEIALYSFLVLVATGVYLALFFEPSTAGTVYDGSYAPLRGAAMSRAYDSTLSLSFDVKAGLLMRQTHHWAALVFVVAIVLHLLRIFFTGAFRKPRDLNYYVGLTILTVALLEGFAGYSLVDDLLSGIGLSIAYGVTLSIPGVGAPLGFLIWDGQLPGGPTFLSRLFIAHVFLLPVVIGALIATHLALITVPRHTQFPGRGRAEANVVGTRLWPAYALRALGLLFATAALLFAMGGLIQINPIWQWGPYQPYLATNGAQPDWYMGWLIGALRLMPPIELRAFDHTLIPNPFFGGVLFPGLVFGLLYGWPAIERRVTGDRGSHHLLERPRDNPWRSGVGAAVFTAIVVVFLAGAADRVFVSFGIPYQGQVWFFRVAFFVAPAIAYLLTRRICEELRGTTRHPLHDHPGVEVRRTPAGGFEPESP